MTCSDQAARVHRAITSRYVLSLLAVAVLSVTAWLVMSAQLTAHRVQDETIALAGAQRMLSHQMAGLLAERMETTSVERRARADADLTAAEQRFLTAFEKLSGSLTDRQSAAALATEQLRGAYYHGDNAVAVVVVRIEQGLDAVRQNRMSPNAAADFIAWMRGPVISTLDAAVAAHKAAAKHTLRHLRDYQGVDLALLLLVLGFEATFVFAPLARRLSKQTRILVATSEKLEATLAEMARLASTDALTGLNNRRALDLNVARLNETVVSEDEPGRIGVISFDLDWFKEVNDRHGHAAGDAVLQAVGERVRAVCRAEDFAARMGGDEFIVLVANAPSLEFVRDIADRIRLTVTRPVEHLGVQMSVGASLGTCLVPDQAPDLATALHIADLALRAAKRSGKSRCVDAASSGAAVEESQQRGNRRVLRFARAQVL